MGQSCLQGTIKIPKKIQLRIVEKIGNDLLSNPFTGIKCHGKFKELYRMRIGDYRVIYHIHIRELIILILRIGDRSNIYKLSL